jgi:chemotaxis protein CheC
MTDEKAGRAIEIIREFANIGAGSAATALSYLLDVELMNDVTSCDILPMAKVSEWLGGADKVVAGTYTYLCGELTSGILVIFPEASAIKLLSHLTKETVNLSSLTNIQKSALKEVGNICLCWYLIAVSKMIDIDMIPAPPDAAVDLLGAVLDLPLASLGQRVDTVLAVHTSFKALDSHFDGYFLMLPEESTLKLILEKMGDSRG